jgi:hypothetical protein
LVIAGTWLSVKRTDERAFALYRRHYSAAKSARWRRPGNTNVTSAGETMVLLSKCCRALFVWRVERFRHDHQSGVNCAVFRNEGAGLSSDLIREADELAWQRWPGERHFTYVDARKIRSVNPGYCFLKADWQKAGTSQMGLVLLERLP